MNEESAIWMRSLATSNVNSLVAAEARIVNWKFLCNVRRALRAGKEQGCRPLAMGLSQLCHANNRPKSGVRSSYLVCHRPNW